MAGIAMENGADDTMVDEAEFWANEQARVSSWAATEGHHNSAAADGNEEELFTLDDKIEFVAMYLGTVRSVQRSSNDLIDYIDYSRKMGNVAWRATRDDQVVLQISKYGLKVTDMRKHEVFARVAMHKIGSVVHYVDDNNQHIVVFECGVPKSRNFTYYIYQSQSAGEAERMAKTIKQAFEIIYAKATLENIEQ